jgi:mannose/fructose-specific phosphotransferase system component IIA
MAVTGVVVVSHGDAGLKMVEAAERVVGPLDVRTVAVGIGEARIETERRIEAACDGLMSDEILFLVDLEGSTPYNLCCRKCKGESVVLSGVNLPMLFKLATADRGHGALGLAEELQATGRKSIHIRTGQGPGAGR